MEAIRDLHDEMAGEQRMWLAVIARAIEEWVSGPQRSRMEADEYLFHDQLDFPAVCAAAGLNADSLRAKLLRLKNSGAGPKPIHVIRKASEQYIQIPVLEACAA